MPEKQPKHNKPAHKSTTKKKLKTMKAQKSLKRKIRAITGSSASSEL